MNYAALIEAIEEVVKTNGNKEITGANLQTVLVTMVRSLGANYTFAGVATPATSAGTPDQNVFYIGGAGTYANFGSTITIPKGSIGVFAYNGSWSNTAITVDLPAYININEIADHPAAYANAATALADVPATYRRKGVKCVYYDDTTELWIELLCIDDAGGANWWTDVENNWVIEGPVATKIATATGGQQLKIAGEKRGNLDDVLNVNAWNENIYPYDNAALARAAVPANKRKLGAIITYLLADGWFTDQFIGTNVSGWTTAENWKVLGPVSVSQNTLTIGGENKGELAGQLIENPEWIWVCTCNGQKIILGFRKSDGAPIFGYGCPPQVVDYITEHFADYDDIKTFLGNLIDGDTLATLLNAKVDKVTGESLIDAEFAKTIKHIQSPEWIDVKTDRDGRIIEGINPNGEKRISKFDNETEEMIKGFVGSSDPVSSVINIPLLDANFTSPVPFKVYDGDIEDETIKGQGIAKYVFDVPLREESFNIRCKVRITENLLNQMKTARIVQLGNVYADAVPYALSQYSSEETYDGSSHTMLWNDFNGGIKYNNGQGDTEVNKLSLGNYAFYIQYTGSENTASVENDGTKFILKIGSTTTEFAYSTYDTVAALYEAIKAVPDVVVAYKELEGRMCDELAIFPECQIKTTCYTKTDRMGTGQVQEYVDAYQFYIPYAVDDLWHQIEIVKFGDTVYCSFDGIMASFQYDTSNDYTQLVLGDGNSMFFKELSIDVASPNDAEYWQNGNRLVSSVNPAIIITEGHGMWDGPVVESADAIVSHQTNELATSTDRLYYVFEKMRSMGYVPVTIKDIAEYYAGNKMLPKRCFTCVFDGERWGDWLETKSKKAFAELGVYPVIAAITGATSDVTYDIYGGTKTITVKEAAELCLKNNFSIVSHTRDHWKTNSVRLSTLIDEFTQDIESSDNCLADGMILVYPGGQKTRAAFAAMKWLGYSLGISIAPGDSSYISNTKARNKYSLTRVEIGFRTTLQTILNKLM